MRGYTLRGRVRGYVLSIQCGLRGRQTPRIARIETAFVLLRDLRAAVVELRLAPMPARPAVNGVAVRPS